MKRLRRAARQFKTPGDVWLAAQTVVWALMLPALKRLMQVQALAPVMWLPPKLPHRDIAREQRIVRFARWATRLVRWADGGNCLERGLIAYRYLSAAGANPALVIGVGRA